MGHKEYTGRVTVNVCWKCVFGCACTWGFLAANVSIPPCLCSDQHTTPHLLLQVHCDNNNHLHSAHKYLSTNTVNRALSKSEICVSERCSHAQFTKAFSGCEIVLGGALISGAFSLDTRSRDIYGPTCRTNNKPKYTAGVRRVQIRANVATLNNLWSTQLMNVVSAKLAD